MEIDRAKELLTILADGINPITGELLPDEDSCNHVEIVRALHSVIMELDNKNKSQTKKYRENSGKPWTEEEEKQLIDEYHEGLKVKDIAKAHERSNGAIMARLLKLGEVENK